MCDDSTQCHWSEKVINGLFQSLNTTTFLVRECNNSYRVVKHQVHADVQGKYEDCVLILHFAFQSCRLFCTKSFISILFNKAHFFQSHFLIKLHVISHWMCTCRLRTPFMIWLFILLLFYVQIGFGRNYFCIQKQSFVIFLYNEKFRTC